MSPPDPTATHTATSPQAQDTETLITLLGNLMPLLLRFQSHAPEQPHLVDPSSLAPQGLVLQGLPLQGLALQGLPLQNPILDHQAAVSMVEDITADALRNLSTYLEAHAGRYPGLESCVVLVTQAAQCFAVRDFAQSFGLIWQAYRVITLLRANHPQLPAVRGAGSAAAPSPTTVIH
jgi:hypothetical protein